MNSLNLLFYFYLVISQLLHIFKTFSAHVAEERPVVAVRIDVKLQQLAFTGLVVAQGAAIQFHINSVTLPQM